MMVHRAFTIATAALAALATAPLNADVKRGVDAWSAGDFQTAVTEWQGPADGGDADALFNLAQAYRLGRGVDADINQARDLYAQGLVGFLDVLDAERTLLDTRQALLDAETDVARAIADLYAAAGAPVYEGGGDSGGAV